MTKDVLKEQVPTFTAVGTYKGLYPMRYTLNNMEMSRYSSLINRV